MISLMRVLAGTLVFPAAQVASADYMKWYQSIRLD